MKFSKGSSKGTVVHNLRCFVCRDLLIAEKAFVAATDCDWRRALRVFELSYKSSVGVIESDRGEKTFLEETT